MKVDGELGRISSQRFRAERKYSKRGRIPPLQGLRQQALTKRCVVIAMQNKGGTASDKLVPF